MRLLSIQRCFQAYYQHVRRMDDFSPDERRQMVSYVHTALNLLEHTAAVDLPTPLAAAYPHSLHMLRLLRSHLAEGRPLTIDLLHTSLLVALKPFAEAEPQASAAMPAPQRLVSRQPPADSMSERRKQPVEPAQNLPKPKLA